MSVEPPLYFLSHLTGLDAMRAIANGPVGIGGQLQIRNSLEVECAFEVTVPWRMSWQVFWQVLLNVVPIKHTYELRTAVSAVTLFPGRGCLRSLLLGTG